MGVERVRAQIRRLSGNSTFLTGQIRSVRCCAIAAAESRNPLAILSPAGRNGILAIILRAIVVVAVIARSPGVSAQESRAFYLPMSDGVRLAADVHFPEGFDSDKKYPAILELTRYWRATIDPKTGDVHPLWNPVDKALLANGYVLLVVDVRGSGASFGHRLEEYGPTEIKDGFEIVDWVCRQSWCDGNIGAKGVSYTGTTAELLTASKHPAIKAVIPGWSDFDFYTSPGRTYGLFPSRLLKMWSDMVGMMDANDGTSLGGQVRPVDAKLLSQAVQEHKQNPNVFELFRRYIYRDQSVGESVPLGDCSSIYWRKEIQESNVPMLVFASWLDAGTADGALIRLQNYSNPQKVVILASNHGGRFHASPFTVGHETIPSDPSLENQVDMRIQFLDRHLKGVQNDVDDWPTLQYFNMGEEAMRESASWPIANTSKRKLFLANDYRLTTESPTANSGDACKDHYEVNFQATTGSTNRWMTQMGGPVLNLNNRSRMEKRLLVYTSEPLTEDLQITGSIVAQLQLASTELDGAILVYFSVVESADSATTTNQEMSRYVTEGGLRLRHRKIVADPHFQGTVPYHSFREADSGAMQRNEPGLVQIRMWPTSVLVRAGQRLRFSIAGHDDHNFDRVPAKETPTLTVFRSSERASFIALPVIGE